MRTLQKKKKHYCIEGFSQNVQTYLRIVHIHMLSDLIK